MTKGTRARITLPSPLRHSCFGILSSFGYFVIRHSQKRGFHLRFRRLHDEGRRTSLRPGKLVLSTRSYWWASPGFAMENASIGNRPGDGPRPGEPVRRLRRRFRRRHWAHVRNPIRQRGDQGGRAASEAGGSTQTGSAAQKKPLRPAHPEARSRGPSSSTCGLRLIACSRSNCWRCSSTHFEAADGGGSLAISWLRAPPPAWSTSDHFLECKCPQAHTHA